ncbi:hypothetical protein BDDG_07646 [Blastomyces dermatitidis ATCC 18188]|uniref:Uncharacterized protein n=2 Tax=Ajellomyces dermatitidis TaxID=5039 RepID=F2TN88_AJEDA|nr:hypothetical protein BDDG_07646 [Blastomyces dermatitidis ATCC 18188]EQL33955.1 hypothetical protein BDFG_04104 [Blastomyces dermatitidis ATCC 26199]
MKDCCVSNCPTKPNPAIYRNVLEQIILTYCTFSTSRFVIMPTLTECHQISEEGNEKLKKLQDAILTGKAVVEMTESNGNVKYANESLNDYVVPLLEALKLSSNAPLQALRLHCMANFHAYTHRQQNRS